MRGLKLNIQPQYWIYKPYSAFISLRNNIASNRSAIIKSEFSFYPMSSITESEKSFTLNTHAFGTVNLYQGIFWYPPKLVRFLSNEPLLADA